MHSLPPPPRKVFFSLYGGSFCYFFSMWEPSATFFFLCTSLYVLGLQVMLCPHPPPRRKNVPKRPSHGIKIAKKSPIYREGRGSGCWWGEEGGGKARRDLITHFKLLLLSLLLRSYAYGYIEMCLPRGEEAPSK